MFTLKIKTDSDAFADDYFRELARILQNVTDTIEAGAFADSRPVFDINGNRVGEWRLSGNR
jgi:hypothetical protein